MTPNTARGRRRALGRLGERLLADGVIGEDSLRFALEQQARTGGFLGEILASQGAVSPTRLSTYLADLTGFPFVDIAEEEVDPNVATRLSEAVVTQHLVLPFREDQDSVHVAMSDPLNLAVVDAVKASLGRPVSPFLALPHDLSDAIRRFYDVRQRTRSVLDEIGVEEGFDESNDDLMAAVEEAPLVRLVNSVLSSASLAGASDIHIEPQEGAVRVRYRIDGVLYDQMTIPSSHLSAFVSRLKVMAALNIAERRRPQDGRFSSRDDTGKEFDVRLSIMPTVWGEKACLRLLEKTNDLSTLDRLGFLPSQKAVFEKFCKKPHGLFLVTGPTGSGKSTSLYAALNSINDSTRNINTVEDPVEYKLPGVNQMQVDPRIGVTFSTGLRTLVRQDPDVILVGEIRDRETAEIAIQAALTGHLVFSTLHTNDAPGAIVRLQNMGVEPFLISSALMGVMGQRLLRVLCPHCRETYRPSMAEGMTLGIEPGPDGQMPILARAAGCRRCGERGMRGRTAAMEIFAMTDAMRAEVLRGSSGSLLSELAQREGMMTMRESAIHKALELQISSSEIMRVFAEEE